jgi:hypothetical protein
LLALDWELLCAWFTGVIGTYNAGERELIPRTLPGPTHPDIDSHSASLLFTVPSPGLDLAAHSTCKQSLAPVPNNIIHTTLFTTTQPPPHPPLIVPSSHIVSHLSSPTPSTRLYLLSPPHTRTDRRQVEHAKGCHMGIFAHLAPRRDAPGGSAAVAGEVLRVV